MIEENNNIDKLFRDKLEERTFAIPPAFLADLDTKLSASKIESKKIKGFWFALSSFLLVGLLTASYFMRGFYAAPQSTVPSVIKSQAPTQTAFTNEYPNRQKTAPNKAAVNDNNRGRLATPRRLSPNSTERVNSHDPAQVEKKNKKTAANRQWSKKPMQHIRAFSQQIDPSEQLQKGESTPFTPPFQVASLGHPLLRDDASFGTISGTQTWESEGRLIRFEDDTTKKIRYIIRDSVVLRDSIVIRDSVRITDTHTQYPELKQPRANKPFEMQVYGGFMAVRPKTISPFQAYPELLKSKTKNILSPDFGFALSTYYKKWTVGTGMNYYHFGEQSDYTVTTSSTKDSITQTQFFQPIFDSNGILIDSISIVLNDTTQITSIKTSNQSVTNTYSQFSLPVRFGYLLEVNQWNFIPRIGLNFEFALSKRSGIYSDENGNNPFEVNQRKFGMSYSLSFEIRRNIGEWHIFANPFYRNNINFIIDSPQMKRKYSAFGATIGIGVRF